MKRSNWSFPYFIFLLIFVVLPLVLIFLYAFQDAEGNFTLKNFAKFISSP
jgi:spermidine/putrescine transport system permease protein